MASIFDVLGSGSIGSILNTFARQAGNIASQAGSAANNFTRKAPGGVGGLLGAGALGALLGNLASSDVVKNVGLIGAGAVAWNFYKKWADKQKTQQQSTPAASAQDHGESSWPGQSAAPNDEVAVMRVDPTSELVMRSMIYAAKADGNIDAQEQSRINAILKNMMGGKDISAILTKIEAEPIDPSKIAAAALPQQADDIYRLSCSVIDVDHFMERSYLDALAKSLHITPNTQREIEQEASAARKQLAAHLNG